jgi:hypothetical protein
MIIIVIILLCPSVKSPLIFKKINIKISSPSFSARVPNGIPTGFIAFDNVIKYSAGPNILPYRGHYSARYYLLRKNFFLVFLFNFYFRHYHIIIIFIIIIIIIISRTLFPKRYAYFFHRRICANRNRVYNRTTIIILYYNILYL